MPTYLTIGYGDRQGYDATPRELRDTAHAHDAALAAAGAVIGTLATPVRVTNTQGRGTSVEPGAFSRPPLPVAGFALIEADTLDDAVAQVAGTPCAVAGGVVEVWEVGAG
jgi:hypothetical protein